MLQTEWHHPKVSFRTLNKLQINSQYANHFKVNRCAAKVQLGKNSRRTLIELKTSTGNSLKEEKAELTRLRKILLKPEPLLKLMKSLPRMKPLPKLKLIKCKLNKSTVKEESQSPEKQLSLETQFKEESSIKKVMKSAKEETKMNVRKDAMIKKKKKIKMKENMTTEVHPIRGTIPSLIQQILALMIMQDSCQF